MDVTSVDGRTWTVRRQWLPARARNLGERLRERLPGGTDNGPDAATAAGEAAWGFDLGVGVGVAVAVLGLLVLALPVLLELLVVAALVVGGIAARIVLRRPWTVEAVASDGERHTRQVVGWRRAGEVAEAWADDLRHGRG